MSIFNFFKPRRESEEVVEEITEEVVEEITEEVVEEITEPDISEPVISFVNTVKDNPKRFKIKIIREDHASSTDYLLVDTVENISFPFKKCDSYLFGTIYKYKEQYITEDEEDFLIKELVEVFKQKEKRLVELRNIRKQRNNKKRRDELKKIYCKGIDNEHLC